MLNITQNYERDNFQDFLRNDFLTDNFTPCEEEIFFDFKNIKQGYKLGEDKTLDLDVFEFETISEFDPRVTLTREVAKLMKKYGASPNALVAFYNSNKNTWRLSLITTDYINENGKIKTAYSNPRRFSFVLGKHCKAHTPQQMLISKGQIQNVSDLHSRFDIEIVTKEFYNKLFEWYSFAIKKVTYPVGSTENISEIKQSNKNNELNLIRLITRLIFVWFIKQKNLVPDWIFDKNKIANVLKNFLPEKGSNYYNAILQNLFFATLNKKIEDRNFATDERRKYNSQFGVKNYFRDDKKESFFKISHDEVLKLFYSVPFLNGGLFECLDKLKDDKAKTKNIQEFTDGFSREPKWRAFVPNELFFSENSEHEGLIVLLNRYNFTVEENTPTDVQVALDPELLGKVFENLLGTYNPETSETARKDSGSFYTPREIVNYMVDESLKAVLSSKCSHSSLETKLNELFNDECDNPFTLSESKQVANAIKSLKILDPAVGSGAFPMGVLLRMAHLLQKLNAVAQNGLYDLKLSLLENCIFGVDIQPIAVQICKLRFFISIICEQERTNDASKNYGIRPLPNLESKFVAANTLVYLAKEKEQVELFGNEIAIDKIKTDLAKNRHKDFSAKTSEEKWMLREEYKELRQKLAGEYGSESAKQLNAWNPYDQNASSSWFSSEWMFNVKADCDNVRQKGAFSTECGFDIVIGNPPYVQLQKNGGALSSLYEKQGYKTFARTGDIYCLFYERAMQLLKDGGINCFITSNKWMRAGYGEALRSFLSRQNPLQLVDFGGVKVFESATVDTNILITQKASNEGRTACYKAATATSDSHAGGDKGVATSSAFARENEAIFMDFSKNSGDSWVILSPIEKSIKDKIEKAGTPLKDWDINIYRGVLTGFNDAFIIDEDTRQGILDACKTAGERKRTEALIRPILRGRDIKRYSYEWAGLYIINTHNGVKEKNIPPVNVAKDYPAVKAHLDKYWDKISKRDDKGVTPYNLRNCAYMSDFDKPKIVYQELTQGSRFAFDKKAEYYVSNTAYMITGEKIEYLLGILNSKLIEFAFSHFYSTLLGDNGIRWLAQNIINLPIPRLADTKEIDALVDKVMTATSDSDRVKAQKQIDAMVCKLYGLTAEEIAAVEKQ